MGNKQQQGLQCSESSRYFTKPSYKDISRWSWIIAAYWQDLAAELGFEVDVVQNITSSLVLYPTPRDQARQMLAEWLQTGTATCGRMAEALRTMGMGGLADEICPPQVQELCCFVLLLFVLLHHKPITSSH